MTAQTQVKWRCQGPLSADSGYRYLLDLWLWSLSLWHPCMISTMTEISSFANSTFLYNACNSSIILLDLRRQKKEHYFPKTQSHKKRSLGPRVTGAKCYDVNTMFSCPGSGKVACSCFSKTRSDSCVYVSITLFKCQL